MSTEYARLLTQLFPAVLMIVLGVVIRVRGPQGFVHGIVDWSKLDDATRRRAGRVVGNVLLAMAALIAGRAVYGYLQGNAAANSPLINMIVIGGIVVLVLGMILMLVRLSAKDKSSTHGR